MKLVRWACCLDSFRGTVGISTIGAGESIALVVINCLGSAIVVVVDAGGWITACFDSGRICDVAVGANATQVGVPVLVTASLLRYGFRGCWDFWVVIRVCCCSICCCCLFLCFLLVTVMNPPSSSSPLRSAGASGWGLAAVTVWGDSEAGGWGDTTERGEELPGAISVDNFRWTSCFLPAALLAPPALVGEGGRALLFDWRGHGCCFFGLLFVVFFICGGGRRPTSGMFWKQ